MTTLSKEDVVRMAAKAHAKGFHCGPPMEAAEFFTLTQLHQLAATRTALAELLTAINNYIPEADHCSDDGIKYYSELVSVLDKHRK